MAIAAGIKIQNALGKKNVYFFCSLSSCAYPAYSISSIICHIYFKRFLMCPYHSQEADSESLCFVNGHVITSNGSHLYKTQCVTTETARLLHLPQFDVKCFRPESIT